MNQLDEAILDALTHATFPRGFVQTEPIWVVMVDGIDYPFWKADALTIGSSAVELRAVVEPRRCQ